MIVFGIVGLIGNLIGLLILASGRSANLNMRAAFLEVVNDALGSVAVLAAAVITTTGWYRADAIASILIGVLIIPRTIRLLPRNHRRPARVHPKGPRPRTGAPAPAALPVARRPRTHQPMPPASHHLVGSTTGTIALTV